MRERKKGSKVCKDKKIGGKRREGEISVIWSEPLLVGSHYYFFLSMNNPNM